MPLLIPTQDQYKESVNEVKDFLLEAKGKIHWAVYGSFANGKLRPGLSDIDIFVISESNNILFPIAINIAFGEVKEGIENLGIPLQVNKITTEMLENPFSSPDYSYLMEVVRGVNLGHSSDDFIEDFVQHRDEKLDDLSMARYFLRKIANIGDNFGKITIILSKDESLVDSRDQKELWFLWDSFKKMLSLFGLAIRIRDGKSVFAEPDKDIIGGINRRFEAGIDLDNYLNILNQVSNIQDWYSYLKNGGLEQVIKIYDEIFIPITNTIYKNIKV